MRKAIIFAKVIKWGIRGILIVFITHMLMDYGLDMIYSLISSTMFVIFYLWFLWTLDYDEPDIEWDENGV